MKNTLLATISPKQRINARLASRAKNSSGIAKQIIRQGVCYGGCLLGLNLLLGCGAGTTNQHDSNVVADTGTITETMTNTNVVMMPTAIPVVSADWQLVWQDEFDRGFVDPGKWQFEVNCFGGGNNEQQCYTDRLDNAFVEEGILNIVAKKEQYSGPALFDDSPDYNVNDTRTLPYTSARLRTKMLADWTYGRFEISAKLPAGQGTWPAIWMLPTDQQYGAWAASGEIDIMEAVNLKTQSDAVDAQQGDLENRVHGTLHYGKTAPDNVYSGTWYRLVDKINPADDFHLYALEWEQGEIRWYVDGVHYATQNAALWYSQYQDSNGVWQTGSADAPFDKRFHLILNLAIGGGWPSNVNDKGIDANLQTQSLLIDYVRVYQCRLSVDSGKGCAASSAQAKLVTDIKTP